MKVENWKKKKKLEKKKARCDGIKMDFLKRDNWKYWRWKTFSKIKTKHKNKKTNGTDRINTRLGKSKQRIVTRKVVCTKLLQVSIVTEGIKKCKREVWQYGERIGKILRNVNSSSRTKINIWGRNIWQFYGNWEQPKSIPLKRTMRISKSQQILGREGPPSRGWAH